MKHTPGPWKVVTYAGHSTRRQWVGKITAKDGTDIYAGAFSFHAISNLHNARLIAAAPELLEALEALVERIDINGGLGPYKGGKAFAVSAARAALAKARGIAEDK